MKPVVEVTKVVSRVAKAEAITVAEVLASAFHDDPVLSWVLPDAERRREQLPRFFLALIRYQHLAGGGAELVRHAGLVRGAALWDPPDCWRQSRLDTLRSLPTVLRVFGGRIRVANSVFHETERVHPKAPHWYLAAIGTSPSARGDGYGDALMRSRLTRCDSEGSAAYLESSNPENLAFYARYGFAVVSEIKLPDGGPSIWPMWRDPR